MCVPVCVSVSVCTHKLHVRMFKCRHPVYIYVTVSSCTQYDVL